MYKKIISLLVCVVFFSTFNSVFAGLIINEVMYDVEGTDTGREWVEIYNNSDTSVDLSTFKFFEANTNHEITAAQGNGQIGSYDYAIISLDPVKFKIDWPSFEGAIFDSSFSLSNDGESLALKDSDLNVVDEYTYSSATGAQGDLKSLQKVSSSWVAAIPTPGVANENTNSQTASPSGTGQNDTGGAGTPGNTGSPLGVANLKITEVPKIKTKILTKNISFAGIPTTFQVSATGYSGEPLTYGKYFLNFGDGDSKEMKIGDMDNLQKFTHTYFYPGEYVVTLEYYTNYYGNVPDASDKIIVKVIGADIIISRLGDEKDFFVELSNNTNYDADISNWVLVAGDNNFTFSKNTILGSKKKVVISSRLTHFYIGDKNTLKLLNQQGELVFDYGASIVPSIPPKTLNRNVVSPKIPVNQNLDVVVPIPEEKLIEIGGQEALAVDSEVIKNSNYSPLFISIIFIGGCAYAVYFIRQRRIVSNTGDDFKILDE